MMYIVTAKSPDRNQMDLTQPVTKRLAIKIKDHMKKSQKYFTEIKIKTA